MSRIRATLVVALVLALIGIVQAPVYAQNATAGLVTGNVVDASNAAVSGATVTLQAKERTESLTATTNAAGSYTFPIVKPGNYSLSATAKGFERSVVSSIEVEVMRSYTVNFTLQIGASTMTVEVKAGTTVEMETTSSTVGSTISGDALEHLPTYARSATSLMFLQPAVTPPYGEGSMANDNLGGQVAGSRSEQITFLLDGGDVTSDLEGSNAYNAPPDEPQPAPIVPIPQEMTQEFRVGVSNPNATFDRSSGGQVAILTKSGTNAWHGEAYEYNNNDGFNANSWTNNESDIPKPHEVDNRFGGNVGGPIWKDKLWFFAGYEGRRFYENATGSAIVPIPGPTGMDAGILRFPDATGTVRSYNLATAMDCSPTGAAACDPRGLGISPDIAAYYAKYPAPSPAPGGATCGDGTNTACYLFAAPTPFLEDIGVLRLDWTINNKWTMFATFHTGDARRTGTEQFSIINTAAPAWISADPFYPNFFSFQVTGQLTPNLTFVSHGSYLRNWWAWDRVDPGSYGLADVSGQDVLQLTGEATGEGNGPNKYLADLTNVNTQQARSRVWNGRDVYVAEDFNYTRGAHLWQFGASFYRYDDIHIRTDDVLGGLTNFPILYLSCAGCGNPYGLANAVGATYEPQACATPTSTFCLTSVPNPDWDELYSATLGIVDHSSQIVTRNGQFQPNPLGTILSDNVKIYAPYGYVQDVWKVRPSVTVTLGVDWGSQLPPSEENGKEALFTSAETGAALSYFGYISQRAHILGSQIAQIAPGVNAPFPGILPGEPFNPQFALTPVNDVPAPFTGLFKQNVWRDFGPRISVAWNVPWKNKIFGNKQTVIRAGYVLLYDRTSAVSEVLNPLLAGGLAAVSACSGPTSPVVTKMMTCSGATTPADAFRIGPTATGWDGNGNTAFIQPPAGTALSVPYLLPAGGFGAFPTFLTAGLDPYISPAHSHNVNLDIQRSLPWNMVLEIGYIGKFSRNLIQSESLNDPYYGTKDALSGQTEGAAFSAVAKAVQTGAAIPTEPWFENQLGGATACKNAAATLMLAGVNNCSQLVAAADPVDLAIGGFGNWAFSQGGAGLDTLLPLVGYPQMDDQQIELFNTDGGHAYSNYNAFIFGLTKAVSHNLQFQFNWTYSKSIGTQGLNSQYLYALNTPYNLSRDYGPEVFDHEHVVNFWLVYGLPFGKGQTWHSSNNVVNNIIGGWTLSGIYTFYTGLPLAVGCDGDSGSAYFLLGEGTPCLSTINLDNAAGYHSGVGAAVPTNPNFIYNDAFYGGAPVGGGTKLNIFANPAAIMSSVSPADMNPVTGLPPQSAWGQLRMIPSWNVDFAVAKKFDITERVKLEVNAQMLNIFNHVLFAPPSLDTLFAGPTFGEFTTQLNQPRRILLGARVTF